MVYREKDEKLELQVSGSEAEVSLKVTCYHGTIVKVSYSNLGPKTLSCGEKGNVGKENTLKGARRLYTGSGNNPLEGKFRVVHEFSAPGGVKLTYTFPDDYTGENAFDESDENPTFQFIMNYI